MTDSNKTEVIMIIDRSGSMQAIWSDTVGGFKKFIQDQKALPGKVNLTLVAFDSVLSMIYDGISIHDCKEDVLNDYGPRGSTALLDTMGFTINKVGQRFASMKEEERPGKVIVCIITDGQENCSREFRTPDKIKEMVEHQTNKYCWEFTYLGANQDSFLIGNTLGVATKSCANFAYSNIGTRSCMDTLSRSVRSYHLNGNMPVMQDVYDSIVEEKKEDKAN